MSSIPFIVSAPSGAGKTTLCNMAVDFFKDFRHSISYTTRSPRPGDVNGVDYHFISEAEFDRMVREGEFLEHAGVFGKRYGTSSNDLGALLGAGYNVILEIDVQGAKSVREKLKEAVSIFLLPPSVEACEERLKVRGKDSPDEIKKRLKAALDEIKAAPEYDYIIINEDLDDAFGRLKSIIIAETSRTGRMLEKVRRIFGTHVDLRA